MMSDNYNILFIDDDLDILTSYQDLLTQEGYRVFCVSDPKEIETLIPPHWQGVVLCDVLLPSVSGLDLLTRFIAQDPDLPVIMITGHGDVPMAVEALQKGAFDFLEKPLSPEKLLRRVESALSRRRRQVQHQLWQCRQLHEHIIGSATWTANFRERLQKLADTQLPIFIHGEIGTGRHLSAQYLHKLSSRKEAPFIHYQYVAHSNNDIQNAVNAAQNGTLLVQHIERLPLSEQQYLVQQLQQEDCPFRLIIISDYSLSDLIKNQQILLDLYYYFIHTELSLIPLRERLADFVDLVKYYIQQAEIRLNKKIPLPDKKQLNVLMNHTWSGNIKELIHVIELYSLGLVSLSRSAAVTDENPVRERKSLAEELANYEKKVIEEALMTYHGRINDVADFLEIPRKKLYLRMKKYGIDKINYK